MQELSGFFDKVVAARPNPQKVHMAQEGRQRDPQQNRAAIAPNGDTTSASKAKADREPFWRAPLVAAAATLVVGLLTAAFTAWYQYWLSQPSLKGRVVFVSAGTVGSASSTVVTVYLVLANNRQLPVTPIDYFLQTKVGGVWSKAIPVNPIKATNGVELEFLAGKFVAGGRPYKLVFPEDDVMLAASINRPILPTQPRGGVLQFYGPERLKADFEARRVDAFRVVVVDAFGEEHNVERTSDDFNHDPRIVLRLDPSIQLLPGGPDNDSRNDARAK